MLQSAGLAMAMMFLSTVPPQFDDVGKYSRWDIYSLIIKEFGGVRGSFIVQNELIGKQVVNAMGVPSPTLRLDDGNYLVPGCRPHSCDEMSAVVVTQDGALLGAAMINYRCMFDVRTRDKRANYIDPDTGYPCHDSARLTYFLRPSTDHARLIGQFRNWAFGALSADRGPIRRFEKVMLPR